MKIPFFFFLIISLMLIIPQSSFSQETREIDEEIDPPQFGLDCPTTTHKFSQETQKCEIWWDSAYVAVPLLILITSAIIITSIVVWKYRKRNV